MGKITMSLNRKYDNLSKHSTLLDQKDSRNLETSILINQIREFKDSKSQERSVCVQMHIYIN